jgi:ATP-binding cassette subfamily B protein
LSKFRKQTPDSEKISKGKVIVRMFGYLFKHPWHLLLVVFLTIASNVLALAAPSLSGKAIDAIVSKGNVDYDTVFLNCALMIGCYILSAVLGFVNSVTMINLSRKVVYIMRKQTFEHLADMPVGYFDKNQTGDLIYTIFSAISILSRS